MVDNPYYTWQDRARLRHDPYVDLELEHDVAVELMIRPPSNEDMERAVRFRRPRRRIDREQRSRKLPITSLPEDWSPHHPEDDPKDNPATRAGTNEEIDRLVEYLPRLTRREQEMIQMRFFEDLSQRRIATLLRCSDQAVSQCIGRALRKLRWWLVP